MDASDEVQPRTKRVSKPARKFTQNEEEENEEEDIARSKKNKGGM